MAPIAISQPNEVVDYISDIKAKVVNGQVEAEVDVQRLDKPPVADDYMYDFQYNHALPTIDVLGREISADADPVVEAKGIVQELSDVLAKGDAEGFASLFLEHGESEGNVMQFTLYTDTDFCKGVWRDKLLFSWDYRTFNFHQNILRAASDLLPSTPVSKISFLKPVPNIKRPYPDLAYLQFVISLDTNIANGHAVINAVLTSEGWRIWTMHTVVESLHEFPPVPPADGHMTGDVSWEKQREKEVNEVEPDVVIVGAGQK